MLIEKSLLVQSIGFLYLRLISYYLNQFALKKLIKYLDKDFFPFLMVSFGSLDSKVRQFLQVMFYPVVGKNLIYFSH